MFYERFMMVERESDEQKYGRCPLHNDTNASFTWNTNTEEWFCHGCGVGGTPVEFIEKYYGVSKKVAQNAFIKYEKTGSLTFPTEEYIETCIAELQKRPSDIAALTTYGISKEIVEEFKLGFDKSTARVTIPIESFTGEYVNVRKYLPLHRRTSADTAKCINHPKCGENVFFPFSAFDPENTRAQAMLHSWTNGETPEKAPIIIVEGEKDCLVAMSLGLNAITGTSGTGIPMTQIGYFEGRDVIVMTDTDTAGTKLADDYKRLLTPIVKSISRVKLPQKDISDYVQQCAARDTEPNIWKFILEDTLDEEIESFQGDSVLLTKSEDVEKLNTWITLENMSIVGTDPKVYSIPTKLSPKCQNTNCDKACLAAPGANTIDIDVPPRDMISFIDSPDRAQNNFMQSLMGCKHMQAEPKEFINAQKIIFQESAAFMEGMDESSSDHRYGIFLFNGNRLMPTHKYDFDCIRVAEPRSQQNYYVIREAKASDDKGIPELSDSGDYDFLRSFKSIANAHDSIIDIINAHYEQWHDILNIEGRPDLFGAIALTYLSMTEIKWRGGTLKGWLDTMVIGDTRTGKSQMAQRFVKSLGMGSYINGENARATGVIGGVQQMGNSWIITWGAIPMNDKGLLVVDEASGLAIEDIKDLSATRSSGAVTINKIAKGEARARTRLMWLSNPRSGKNLEEYYWKGYGAFTEFIPVAEDQARYDLVLTAAREDVQVGGHPEENGLKPPIADWQQLVTFAWNATSEQIEYTDAVARYISSKAKYLDDLYGGGPLVVGVAVHEKIIRLATACAVFTGSFRGRILVITEKHVDYAIEFMEWTYNKKSLDYKNYIREYKRSQDSKGDNATYIRGLISQYPAMSVLLSANIIRGVQIREVLGISNEEATKLISTLVQKRLLKLTGSGAYSPDKLLIEITKEMEV